MHTEMWKQQDQVISEEKPLTSLQLSCLQFVFIIQLVLPHSSTRFWGPYPPSSLLSSLLTEPQLGQCRGWEEMAESYHGKRSSCPQLTQFILECVILGKNGVGIPTSASSNKPVHVGVPAVHKATEMIFFKITFWQKRNKNIPHGDVLQSFLLDIKVCFSLPLSTGMYQDPWSIPVKKREIL